MQKAIRFPIKGTFYYSAFEAMQENLIAKHTSLILKPEPDNQYDKHALQIWLPTHNSTEEFALLLGYVPRQLSKKLNHLYSQQRLSDLHIIHTAQQGKRFEIDCQITINQAWQDYLIVFMQSQWITTWHKLNRLTKRWLAG